MDGCVQISDLFRFSASLQLAAKDPRAFAIAAQFASDVASGAIGNVEGLRKTVHRIGGDDALAKVPEAGNLSAAAFADAVSQVARTTTPEAGNCCGYAAKDSSGHLEPYGFSRRTVGSGDVRIQLNFCGMCYSDVHQVTAAMA